MRQNPWILHGLARITWKLRKHGFRVYIRVIREIVLLKKDHTETHLPINFHHSMSFWHIPTPCTILRWKLNTILNSRIRVYIRGIRENVLLIKEHAETYLSICFRHSLTFYHKPTFGTILRVEIHHKIKFTDSVQKHGFRAWDHGFRG